MGKHKFEDAMGFKYNPKGSRYTPGKNVPTFFREMQQDVERSKRNAIRRKAIALYKEGSIRNPVEYYKMRRYMSSVGKRLANKLSRELETPLGAIKVYSQGFPEIAGIAKGIGESMLNSIFPFGFYKRNARASKKFISKLKKLNASNRTFKNMFEYGEALAKSHLLPRTLNARVALNLGIPTALTYLWTVGKGISPESLIIKSGIANLLHNLPHIPFHLSERLPKRKKRWK